MLSAPPERVRRARSLSRATRRALPWAPYEAGPRRGLAPGARMHARPARMPARPRRSRASPRGGGGAAHVAGGQVLGDVLQQHREGKRGGRGGEVHDHRQGDGPEVAGHDHGEQHPAILAQAAGLQRLVALRGAAARSVARPGPGAAAASSGRTRGSAGGAQAAAPGARGRARSCSPPACQSA